MHAGGVPSEAQQRRACSLRPRDARDTIVGIEYIGGVTIAGDCGGLDGFAHVVATPKVLRRGEILIGAGGNLKPRNLIEHVFQTPPVRSGISSGAYSLRSSFQR